MSARGEGRPREAWERIVTVTVSLPTTRETDCEKKKKKMDGMEHGKSRAAESEPAIRLLTETISASLAELSALVSSTNDRSQLIIDVVTSSVSTLNNHALSLVSYAREHAEADVRLLRTRLEKKEHDMEVMRYEHAVREAAAHQLATWKIEDLRNKLNAAGAELEAQQAKSASDIDRARKALQACESQHLASREQLAREQQTARANIERLTATWTERLDAKSNSASACHKSLSREMIQLEDEAVELQAKLATREQEMFASREHKDAIIGALSREMDRLRALIKEATRPSPALSIWKALQLESLKKPSAPPIDSATASQEREDEKSPEHRTMFLKTDPPGPARGREPGTAAMNAKLRGLSMDSGRTRSDAVSMKRQGAITWRDLGWSGGRRVVPA